MSVLERSSLSRFVRLARLARLGVRDLDVGQTQTFQTGHCADRRKRTVVDLRVGEIQLVQLC